MSDMKSLLRAARVQSPLSGQTSPMDNRKMKKGEKINHGNRYRDIRLE